ncbi:hypothetical protein SAMN04489844_0131 [Nocardioides exalbidus]|uniref:Uncharacterized protein n=1 Tax=Nocardioides exalbidus TaxID=402596 RepID=A0A1H4JGX6_9ACTN|nr:hypothetical protein SAMN04489844_0131 [Nocardioides exalbidus]
MGSGSKRPFVGFALVALLCVVLMVFAFGAS